MTWPPRPQRMGLPVARALSRASTTERNEPAARIFGSESSSPRTPLPLTYGLAKSSTRTLPPRAARGTVLSRVKSMGWRLYLLIALIDHLVRSRVRQHARPAQQP